MILLLVHSRVSTPTEGADPRFSQVILAISQVLFDPKSQVFYFLAISQVQFDPNRPKSQVFSGFPRSSQYDMVSLKNYAFRPKLRSIDKN